MEEQQIYNTNATLRTRLVQVITHVAIWAVVLSLPFLLDTHHGIDSANEECARKFRYLNFVTNLSWAIPFYLNAYLLATKLFYRRRYVLYTGILLMLFSVLLYVNFLFFNQLFNGQPEYHLKGAIRFLLPAFALTIAVSTAFRVVKDKFTADRRLQEQQQENLKTELSFLRSQINPHFIFNILNNVVALEQLKSPELGPTILKLAALMQYMLYETDEDKVPLEQEVNYLQSYIDLQQQRFGQKVVITTLLDAGDNYFEIEPMLLIPFVENAFKHGVGLIEHPAIDIKLTFDKGTLYFSVRNRFNPASAEVRDKTSGIGLGNVKRRLELLYGNNHMLNMTRDGEWFSVSLELKFH